MIDTSTAASLKPMARTRSPPVSPDQAMVRPSTACVDTPDRYRQIQRSATRPCDASGYRDTVGKAGDEVRGVEGKAWLAVLGSPWTWPAVAIAAVAASGQVGPGWALAATGILGVAAAALATGLAVVGRGRRTDESQQT